MFAESREIKRSTIHLRPPLMISLVQATMRRKLGRGSGLGEVSGPALTTIVDNGSRPASRIPR